MKTHVSLSFSILYVWKGDRERERERERGADVCNDKDVLVNSQRLFAKTTTTDVSFLLFNSVRID